MDQPFSPAPDLQACSVVDAACAQVQRMLAAGAARRELLTTLAMAGETVAGVDATVSILVLDADGLLRDGASPRLPADYLQAIDRLRPDPRIGTCAAAAATGCVVFTPDFRADDRWAELRHLPLALGYVAAWSQPIKSPAGRVLGTFGTYFRQPRMPSADEQRDVALLAEAAARALEASA